MSCASAQLGEPPEGQDIGLDLSTVYSLPIPRRSVSVENFLVSDETGYRYWTSESKSWEEPKLGFNRANSSLRTQAVSQSSSSSLICSNETEHLDTDRRQIRLLTLLPGQFGSLIRYTLQIVSLDDDPRYEALSYVWGDPRYRLPIFSKDRTLLVTENLEAALRHLRLEDKPRILWIDAVCINQEDLDERSHQVSMMGSVYRTARRVLVWLGEGDEDTDYTLKTLKAMADGRHREDVTDMITFFSRASDLFARPWWSRVWVVQEIALTLPDPLIICGRKSIPWSDFFSGAEEASQLTPASWLQRDKRLLAYALTGRALLYQLGLLNVARTYSAYALSTALIITQFCKAAEPRDHIYGLLGLIDIERPIIPDYHEAIGKVYWEAMCHLAHEGDVSCILDQWSFAYQIEGYPSWVPDFSRQPDKLDRTLYSDIAQASGSFSAQPYQAQLLSNDTLLSVTGISVDTVHTTSSLPAYFSGGDSPSSYNRDKEIALDYIRDLEERMHQHVISSNEKCLNLTDAEAWLQTYRTKELFWQTLTLNSVGEANSSSTEDRCHQYEVLLQRASPPSNFPSAKTSEEWSEQYVHKLQTRITYIVAKYTFFHTHTGLVGFAPIVQEGDLIVVLFGAEYPYILRPRDNKYVFIGTAYVGGVMDGQMVDDLVAQDLMGGATETFNLC